MTAPPVMLPRHAVLDSELTWKARGVLAALVALDEAGEVPSTDALVDLGIEGRTAVHSALRELEQAGYLRRGKVRTAGGHYGGFQLELTALARPGRAA